MLPCIFPKFRHAWQYKLHVLLDKDARKIGRWSSLALNLNRVEL